MLDLEHDGSDARRAGCVGGGPGSRAGRAGQAAAVLGGVQAADPARGRDVLAVGTVESKAGQHYDGNGGGHSTSKSSGCSSMSHRTHGERVIADGLPAAAHSIGGGGAGRGRGSSGLAQPLVERCDAALELG